MLVLQSVGTDIKYLCEEAGITDMVLFKVCVCLCVCAGLCMSKCTRVCLFRLSLSQWKVALAVRG